MPAIDFSTHDPEFSERQVEQCLRIIEGLRKINSKIVRLGGSLEELTAAGDRVEALYDALDEVTRKRSIESFRFEFDYDQPNAVIPFNPATGAFNPIAPQINMAVEGDRLICHCKFSNCYESAPDTVQGGMVAAVWDQVLAYGAMLNGVTGPTLWTKVVFLKPTPINQDLRFESEIESVDGKKLSVRGSCYHGAEKVSEAEGLVLAAYEIKCVGAPAKD